MTKATQTRLFKHENLKSQAARIRRYVLANPKLTCKDVAEHFKVDVQTVYNARHTLRKHTSKTISKLDLLKPTALQAPSIGSPSSAPSLTVNVSPKPEPKEVNIDAVHDKRVDMVNNPPHYKVGGLETIDILKAKLTKEEYRGYLKGNVIKYATRAGYKGASAEDAGKLAWYAQRLAELGE